MATQAHPHPARRTRHLLRHLLRLSVAAFLAALLLLTCFHQLGLPPFLTRAIVQEVAARGLHLEFSRVRLKWYRGIVAEEVHLRPPLAHPQNLSLTLPEVAVRVDPTQLLRLRLAVRSLELTQGQLDIPLTTTNDSQQTLTLNNLNAVLLFPPDDQWQLDHLTADCLGMRLRARGVLHHASALSQWTTPKRPLDSTPLWELTLKRYIGWLNRFDFGQIPELSFEFESDARYPDSLNATVRFGATSVSTTQGSLGRLTAILQADTPTPKPPHARFRLRFEADNLQLDGLVLRKLRLGARWNQSLTNPVPEHIDLDITLQDLASPWGDLPEVQLAGAGRHLPDSPGLVSTELRLASGALSSTLAQSATSDLTLRLVHDLDELLPVQGDWNLEVKSPDLGWGTANRLRLDGRLARRPPDPLPPSPPPGWKLAWPWQIDINAELDHLSLSNVTIDRLVFGADWQAPRLRLSPVHAELLGRHLHAEAGLDVAQGALMADLNFDLDVRQLGHLLPYAAHRWLKDYQWPPESPPAADARLWMAFPAGSNMLSADAWKTATRSLTLEGRVAASPAAFRGIPIDSVRFDVHFTNQVWHLTHFVATAPEGRFTMQYREDQRSHDYRFDILANLDPRAFRSLVPTREQAGFDLFQFSEPPGVSGFVSGRWRDPTRTAFAGRINATNFQFRNEPIESFSALLEFTNNRVSATHVHLQSEGVIQADRVEFDIPSQQLTLLNARTDIAPMRIAHAIGPGVAQTLSPYRFSHPPRATVNGTLNVTNTHHVNLRFELEGGPFHYWHFNLPDVHSHVTWSNDLVRIDPLQARFYDGSLTGWFEVDTSSPQPGADFRFDSRIEGVDFGALMRDLLSPTNRLEGRLAGAWRVTGANTDDWQSWQGYGWARLDDGFLYDLPLFGVFSDLLENLGLPMGRNPVTGLSGDFAITNSLIHTRNLQLRSPAMRLDYRGTFDFQGAIDARVEARPLRDTAIVGPLVSLLLTPLSKALELRVHGSLGAPQIEPVYVPKALLFPLNPVGTFKELFRWPDPRPAPPPPAKPASDSPPAP
jgi:hypothetical protein